MSIKAKLMRRREPRAAKAAPANVTERRLGAFRYVILFAMFVVAWRLFALQVLSAGFYSQMLASQRDRYSNLQPDRGAIYALDPAAPDGRFPVAVNKKLYTVFADTRDVKNVPEAVNALAPLLLLDAQAMFEKMSVKNDPYVPIKTKVDDAEADKVRALGIRGIGLASEPHRFYPEKSTFSQVVGFYGAAAEGDGRVGKYGVEGHWQEELAGSHAAPDETGSLGELLGGIGKFLPATDGDDLTLTIDRNIQYMVCDKLKAAVTKHSADGGSAVVLNPKTGAIMALCNAPDFDPNDASAVTDFGLFNNRAIFAAYEPGSIFKAVTMAAGIDSGKVSPHSTYVDEGSVKIGPFTIRNSDGKAHGLQTMTQVLDESLNTGTIYIANKVGTKEFLKYVEAFGLGTPTGIDLDTESSGNIESLYKKGDIWNATASYGQGITVTPLQMATAYAAIANGGKLMKPYVVGGIRHADGTEEVIEPVVLRQVITKRAAALVSGMLVSVVENGHGKKAAVPGYWVAGKTGTAQVPNPNGSGYLVGVNIGSFAGFAPVDDPAFVVVVKLDHPKDVEWAESSAGPLFGEIAKYLLHYLQIPPQRPL